MRSGSTRTSEPSGATRMVPFGCAAAGSNGTKVGSVVGEEKEHAVSIRCHGVVSRRIHMERGVGVKGFFVVPW
jgi:hypothetical protein